MNDEFRIEETDKKLDVYKLMQREKILFYHDLTLFEDELHDNGISSCSVKIVSMAAAFKAVFGFTLWVFVSLQRVMPSGFFVLLRYFLRVDNVMLKMNDTRLHYEIENDFILKEYTAREAKYDELKSVSVKQEMIQSPKVQGIMLYSLRQ